MGCRLDCVWGEGACCFGACCDGRFPSFLRISKVRGSLVLMCPFVLLVIGLVVCCFVLSHVGLMISSSI